MNNNKIASQFECIMFPKGENDFPPKKNLILFPLLFASSRFHLYKYTEGEGNEINVIEHTHNKCVITVLSSIITEKTIWWERMREKKVFSFSLLLLAGDEDERKLVANAVWTGARMRADFISTRLFKSIHALHKPEFHVI